MEEYTGSIVVDEYRCPNPDCGCEEFEFQGYQWFPLSIFKSVDEWEPVRVEDDEGALKVFTCMKCLSTYMEPSLIRLELEEEILV